VFWLLRSTAYIILLCGGFIFGDIVMKGSATVFRSEFPFVNTTFLTEAPESLYVFEHEGVKREMGDREFRAFREAERLKAEAAGRPVSEIKATSYVYSAGGIFPCIVGTVLLVVGSMSIALCLGVASAIFLTEYARQGTFIRLVRLTILNLAGVPSIVFGLFGMGLFVIFLDWNVSLLAGWFTLALMVLPVVITASEESLKAVPAGFREASLALGATKWQTVRKAVLPFALPGILTSSILGIARVAGETAPIMFTAAFVVRDKLPWEDLERASDFFFQGVMALPYHIYVVSSKIPQNEYTERVQYGTAFVFLLIVALIATSAIVLRARLRRRYRW
jgi:phosphate transport system permease protein